MDTGVPTKNRYSPLEAQEMDDIGSPGLTDSETEEEEERCPPPPISRWVRVQENKPRRKSKHASDCQCCNAGTIRRIVLGTELEEEGEAVNIAALIEVRAEPLGIN